MRTTYLSARRISYEYYWGYRFKDTAWRHLPPLLSRIVRTRRSQLHPGTLSGGVGNRHKAMRLVVLILSIGFGASAAVAVANATSAGQSPDWLDSSSLEIAPYACLILLVLALALALALGVLTTVRTLLALPVVAAAGAMAGYLARGGGEPHRRTVERRCDRPCSTLPVLLYPFRMPRWLSLGSANSSASQYQRICLSIQPSSCPRPGGHPSRHPRSVGDGRSGIGGGVPPPVSWRRCPIPCQKTLTTSARGRRSAADSLNCLTLSTTAVSRSQNRPVVLTASS